MAAILVLDGWRWLGLLLVCLFQGECQDLGYQWELDLYSVFSEDTRNCPLALEQIKICKGFFFLRTEVKYYFS